MGENEEREGYQEFDSRSSGLISSGVVSTEMKLGVSIDFP